MWVAWRKVLGEGLHTDEQWVDEFTGKLAKYLAYSYFSSGNNLAKVRNKMTAVQHCNRVAGIELPSRHLFVKAF